MLCQPSICLRFIFGYNIESIREHKAKTEATMSLTIRLASTADAPQIYEIYSPIVRDTAISFEQAPPDVKEIAARITKTLQQYPWLVCEIERQIVGYAYASSFRSRFAYQWTAETTVYVHQDYQRRGIARALYTSLLAILRQQGYCNAIGVIALPNHGSVRAHETLGFRKIGVFENMGYKLEGWHDTGWWQLELRPMPAAPQAPCPVMILAEQADFEDLLQAGQPFVKV